MKLLIKKGEKYNRLTAIRFDHKSEQRNQIWLFKCDCGNNKIADVWKVKNGYIESCGCLHKERVSKANTTHGKTNTPEYSSWAAMKNRCLNKDNKSYKDYGNRGITICNRWLKFENFYKDMGKRPSLKYSIDRIDNNGNYDPSNCRWATIKQQENNRRNNIFVSVNGAKMPFSELAQMLGLNADKLYQRIFKYKWDLKKALTKK